jgi:hypothetical protein
MEVPAFALREFELGWMFEVAKRAECLLPFFCSLNMLAFSKALDLQLPNLTLVSCPVFPS